MSQLDLSTTSLPLAHRHAWRRHARVSLSVVVPCFNEEDVLERTHARLTHALAGENVDLELIYVDDGSRDGTADVLRELLATDARVRVVRLSRNFGHQVAVTAGLDHATGAVVVLIDADLQDPPEVIAEMLARWRDGFDVAYGRRLDRAGETPLKLLTARWFYRVMNWISETPIPADVGDFRLLDRGVVDALKQMPEADRFLRGMVSWVGFRQTQVLYHREARAAGQSKYPLARMMRLAVDGILSFSNWPLRMSLWAGAALVVAGLVGAVCLCGLRFVGHESIADWSIVLAALAIIGGMQLLAIGAVGEYVSRVYRQSRGRPLYVTAERLGFAAVEQRRQTA
ncbi:MAG: glycosyltransferase family 2 protein [Planctomycetes bacterium]|nr:glycosyltransferase family 2 protein [Planctomycetota bacterium]